MRSRGTTGDGVVSGTAGGNITASIAKRVGLAGESGSYCGHSPATHRCPFESEIEVSGERCLKGASTNRRPLTVEPETQPTAEGNYA